MQSRGVQRLVNALREAAEPEAASARFVRRPCVAS
jgi:hypothetical protein